MEFSFKRAIDLSHNAYLLVDRSFACVQMSLGPLSRGLNGLSRSHKIYSPQLQYIFSSPRRDIGSIVDWATQVDRPTSFFFP